MFRLDTGLWKGHAHNLPLELMVSYGIPAAVLIFAPIIILVVIATRKIFSEVNIQNNLIFEKAWIVSLLVLLSSQLVDVQYFDGRISILFWILLSGTKNIIIINPTNFKKDANFTSQ